MPTIKKEKELNQDLRKPVKSLEVSARRIIFIFQFKLNLSKRLFKLNILITLRKIKLKSFFFSGQMEARSGISQSQGLSKAAHRLLQLLHRTGH